MPVTAQDYYIATLDETAVSDLTFTLAMSAVASALRSAVYEVDSNGDATDPQIGAAIRTATILQIQALVRADAATVAAQANPLGRPLASASIDGVSYTTDGPAADPLALPADGSLCPAALLQLERVPRMVRVYG